MVGVMFVGAMPRLAHAAEGVAESEALEPLPAPSAVRPPPPANNVADTVYLRGGAMIRGTVYEVLPSDHVTILHPSGLSRKIPWAEVERVELAYRAPGIVAAPGPTVAPIPAPPPEKRGATVRVHIASKKSVQLYRKAASDGEWHEACTSPCDENMPLGDEYRISGSGIHQSHDFELDGAAGGRVVLTIDPGSRTAFVTGGVLVAVGGLVDYFSLVAFAAAQSHSSCTSYYTYTSGSSCSSGSSGNGTAVGVGMLVVGTAMMGAGAIIMLSNNSTGVSQDQGTVHGARTLDGYRREAIWHTPSAVEQAAPPAMLSLPILNRTF